MNERRHPISGGAIRALSARTTRSWVRPRPKSGPALPGTQFSSQKLVRVRTSFRSAKGLRARGGGLTGAEGGPHQRERRRQVAGDQRCRDANHPPARAEQSRIADRIEPNALGVHPAIDLDHEPRGAARKVGDVPPDDHLPPKSDAEAATAKRGPEDLLAARRMPTQMVRPSLELELTLAGLTMLIGRKPLMGGLLAR